MKTILQMFVFCYNKAVQSSYKKQICFWFLKFLGPINFAPNGFVLILTEKKSTPPQWAET